jgi:hypothetical protein
MKIKRILIIIGCVLWLLGTGYTLAIYMVGKAFEEIGEILADEFLVNHLYSVETYYNNKEEIFNKIDSVAQEMIHSNPEGVLNDSAKQVLEQLFYELFPACRNSLDSFVYFYPKLIQINTIQPRRQPDSTKTCLWGYVWIPAPLIYDSENHWVNFNKTDGNYSTEIWIYKWHIPENRGWYFCKEGCN